MRKRVHAGGTPALEGCSGGLDRLARLRRLPGRALAAAGLMFGTTLIPIAVAIRTSVADGSSVAGSELLPGLVVACVAFAVVVAFDPPRSASPLAYARQLRARFLELQATFDADDRRRPGEGKEKEDDRVPSEP